MKKNYTRKWNTLSRKAKGNIKNDQDYIKMLQQNCKPIFVKTGKNKSWERLLIECKNINYSEFLKVNIGLR